MTVLSQWAEEHADVVALALIGSHARGAARPDSDVDVAVLCDTPDALTERPDWTSRFGAVREVVTESYGAVRSLRVHYLEGLEVEFGIAAADWASVPLDPGTRKVIPDGMQVFYDPAGLLGEAKAEATA